MITCKVLKTFDFSHDGSTIETAREGATISLPNNLVPGLVKEGYVGESTPPKKKPTKRGK